ncbi:hypothetical protein [Dictyobacter aurantiacus]|uniref:Uncharacterized protein n=1 Tax=Dictyobacter aurantiacus TaxID=1936993 RepID=A0A401ZQ22_9CHLR|nr:hypothetical protein [Dictyobacter aurantiacus]GCE08967.1 hypothetical protein KDAU_62960 [Dictyobacter aurantiacus]
MKKRVLQILVLPMLMLAFLIAMPLSASAATDSVTPQAARHHKAHFFTHSQAQRHAARQFASGGNLNYGGGPVMGGTTNVYAIFWEPTGNVSSTYHSLIQRYFSDVGGTGLYNINTQYTDSSGNAPSNTQFAGSWTDNSAYPESPLLDSDIQNEVTNAINANGWSPSIDNIFFVFTEAGQDLCFDSSQSQCASNAFCAYHNYFGSNTIYAAMPYAASFNCNGGQGPNGDQAADETINVTSHEQMEAATDPLLNAWTDSSGQENGDKCAWNFGTVNSDGSNVNFNGDPYLLQQEWDNNISDCALTGP